MTIASPSTLREAVVPGFATGVAAPWLGLVFLAARPSLWALASVPVLFATAIAASLIGLAVHFVPELVAAALPAGPWYATAGRWGAEAIGILVATLLALVIASLLAPALAAPALERLARAAERQSGLEAERRATSLGSALARSGRSALVALVGTAIVTALTVAEFVFPGAAVVLLPLKLALSGVFVAWDYLDFATPLSEPRARRAWMLAHKAATLGFGISLAVAFLVPLASLLLLPAGVVGAARLVTRSRLAGAR